MTGRTYQMRNVYVLIFSSLYMFPICKYKYKKGHLKLNSKEWYKYIHWRYVYCHLSECD